MDSIALSAVLSEREILALSLYYAERSTQSEVGAALGVTREWACKLIGRSVAKLRAAGMPQPQRIGRPEDGRVSMVQMSTQQLDTL
jgi:hypothetical protein